MKVVAEGEEGGQWDLAVYGIMIQAWANWRKVGPAGLEHASYVWLALRGPELGILHAKDTRLAEHHVKHYARILIHPKVRATFTGIRRSFAHPLVFRL